MPVEIIESSQTMTMDRKVFIMSWDGATWNVLRPFIECGWMPNLAKAAHDGMVSDLESVIPPLTAPAWVSFMTGKNPGKHGIFDFRNFDAQKKEDYITNISFCRSKTLWEILSEHGKKSIVLNLPYTYPPPQINGIVISGFDAITSNDDFIYPRELKNEIMRRWPNYRPAMPVWDYLSINDLRIAKQYFVLARESVNTRIEVAQFLLQQYEWDVFLVHFQEIDYIQHAFWQDIENIVSKRDTPLVEEIKDFFGCLDVALTKLPFFDTQDNVISFLISDHGFGSHPGMIFPNVLLKQWGFLYSRNVLRCTIEQWCRRTLLLLKRNNPIRYWQARFLRSGKQTQSEWIVHEKMKTPMENLNIDWKKTKAIMATGDFYALVFINRDLVTKDRYDSLVQELASRFREVKHTKDEGPLFKFVYAAQEIYDCDIRTSSLPDLVLVPSRGYSVTRDIDTDNIVQYGFPGVSGIHRKDGVVVVHSVSVDKVSPRSLYRIIDMTPTILYLLEVAIPYDMDGKVWEDIFTFHKQIVYSKDDSQRIHEQVHYGDDDEEAIKEKLRSLGYLQG